MLLNRSDIASALQKLSVELGPIEKLQVTLVLQSKFLSTDLDIDRFKDASLPVNRWAPSLCLVAPFEG
jgi:hypothetical protein